MKSTLIPTILLAALGLASCARTETATEAIPEAAPLEAAPLEAAETLPEPEEADEPADTIVQKSNEIPETMSEATNKAAETEKSASGDVKVKIVTSLGDITVLLYGDTPRHRDNFLKLIKDGVYDGVLFHRVIDKFMVQTGDPDSKNAPAGKMLGSGDLGYTLEAEFVYPKHFHKRGALAAARQGDNVNPQRRSSGSQFYIVTGQTFNDQQLTQMERQLQMAQQQDIFNRLAAEHRSEILDMRRNRDSIGLQNLQEKLIALTEAEAKEHPAKLTDEQRSAYTTVGGAPHLDSQYTVFGEVLSGMDVVEKIEKAETDRNDRPKEDIRIISMEVLK